MSGGRVIIQEFESDILKGNFLDDPSVRRVAVYLPPGYAEGTARYPTLFMLAGLTSRGTMMLNEHFWDENIAQRLDRLIGAGAILPMIVVMPDCSTRYGGSQYINSLGTGRYQDHIVEELVPWVDGTFRTIPERYFRAVAGKSSGGYGSLLLAMQQPEAFSVAACHSGDMYFEYSYGLELPRYLRAIKKYGGLQKFLENFKTIRPKDGDFYTVTNIIAMASCYSPNLDSPYGFDLPVDEYTGERLNEVWARWKAWDPVELVAAYADALRYQRLLFLDCGTRDEFNLQYGARIFCSRLDQHQIPYHYDEFDDGHRDTQYRLDVSLQAISAVWKG